jgi:hypothetical protein
VTNRAITAALVLVMAGPMTSSAPASFAWSRLTAQSDLDAFMQKVVARRDENWKKLQQYILDETEQIQVRGPSQLPIWGDRREYTWFIKDGYFVRSPLKANGVTITEDERRKYEERYLRRAKNRDKRDAERRAKEAGGDPADQPAAERVPEELPASMDAFLSQSRAPEFVDSAYFLKFKFEQGKYALVGRETIADQETLRIEYYPAKLFSDEKKDKPDPNKPDKEKQEDKRFEETLEKMMNKVSLVTIWVEPKSYQIVKYTFDNVNFDFLPAAWLLRIHDLKASMTMSQPIRDVKDLWLPQHIDFYFSGLVAIGAFDARYQVDYHDYRQATATGRIKRGNQLQSGGLRPAGAERGGGAPASDGDGGSGAAKPPGSE